MSKHHQYGPSTLNHRIASPCFIPKNDVNEHTVRGTALHTAMENMSDEGLEPQDQWAFHEAIQQLMLLGVMDADCKFIFDCEKEIQVTLRDGETDLTYGTADLLFFDYLSKELVLMDYKFGKWPVPQPSENLQLQVYGAAALQAYPDFTKCSTYIIQPGQSYNPGRISRSAVDGIVKTVGDLINECKERETSGELTPSVKACMFCQRFPTCNGAISLVENLL